MIFSLSMGYLCLVLLKTRVLFSDNSYLNYGQLLVSWVWGLFFLAKSVKYIDISFNPTSFQPDLS